MGSVLASFMQKTVEQGVRRHLYIGTCSGRLRSHLRGVGWIALFLSIMLTF